MSENGPSAKMGRFEGAKGPATENVSPPGAVSAGAMQAAYVAAVAAALRRNNNNNNATNGHAKVNLG